MRNRFILRIKFLYFFCSYLNSSLILRVLLLFILDCIHALHLNLLEKSYLNLKHLNKGSDSALDRFLVVCYYPVQYQVFSISFELVWVRDSNRKYLLFLLFLSYRCGNLSLLNKFFRIIFVEKEVLVYCYVLLRVHFYCYWPHFLFFH